MSWRSIGSARASPFTRLDLSSKLAIALLATGLAFLWEDPRLMTGLALGVVLLCLLARIRPSYLWRVLLVLLPFCVIVLLTQGLWNTAVGRTPLWGTPANWPLVGGRLTLTSEGLAYGAMVILRTLTLILVIPLAIFTTDLNALTVGLVRMHVPFKVAFVFTATLRFIPMLFGEIQSITDAQRLRGLALEKMNVGQRLVVYSRIAVPLILGAMTRSQQTEVALAARAFSGSAKRTYLHESRMRAVDWLVIGLSAGLLVAAVVLRFTTGLGRFGALRWQP
jgi:energy-coupling factor transport system permease protein